MRYSAFDPSKSRATRKRSKAVESTAITSRSAALQFEAEPAVPGADVERALAAQIGRNGELRHAACAGCSSV
jgi:hypothetical protein